MVKKMEKRKEKTNKLFNKEEVFEITDYKVYRRSEHILKYSDAFQWLGEDLFSCTYEACYIFKNIYNII